ncbi:sensor histidine kinase [Pseudomonas sp. NPDC087639]|uniref:sensor histidine kinase n=1 Tax=Pseudomonas sp. NPDC087639 TaxID=3364445 RepID=UPI003807822B
MHNQTEDLGSALAIRAEYRQAQSRAARLRLLVDTGQELTRLDPVAMRARVLERACAFLAMDHGVLIEWDAEAQVKIASSQGSAGKLKDLNFFAAGGIDVHAWLKHAMAASPTSLQVQLVGSDGAPFGLLFLANTVNIPAPDVEDVESLQLLATLLAAHLENDRLLMTLRAREQTMSDLVHRLFSAQEDERKRMAYDLHDGLAQKLAGLHQRLQGFAGSCPRMPEALDADLKAILALAQHCVGEGRQLISGLRPTVLDDFGLQPAVNKEADRLREAGVDVHWNADTDARLPNSVEIALFRIAQEAINNILKHSRASRVTFALEAAKGQASLRIDDDGEGFVMGRSLDTEGDRRLGMAAMRERANFLDGSFKCDSQPGSGTKLHVVVPFALDGSAYE